MPEDQLTALPPEVRTMVMTGTTAMMNQTANGGMMGPGVMMDMSGMMGMGMGMGLGGDMGMGGAMMQMQDGQAGVVTNGTSEQVAGNVAMMQDGFNGGQAPNMMNMGMGGAEYGMQVDGRLRSSVPPHLFSFVGAKPHGAADVPQHGWSSTRSSGAECQRHTRFCASCVSWACTRHDSWARILGERSRTGRRLRGRWWYVELPVCECDILSDVW